MNIIQSFYQIENKTCYNVGNSNANTYLINFYSLLLSYITINKLYGKVTMYCNDFAYDKMLKYIPYDDIVKEDYSNITSNNYGKEWGLLKFNIFDKQTKPFIHIDGDVFLFKDLLSNYIDNNDYYDGIVQSIDIDDKFNMYNNFYSLNKNKLFELGFTTETLMNISHNKYNSFIGYNNGVIGFNNLDFMKKYLESGIKMNTLINKGVFVGAKHQTMMFEQFSLYLLSQMSGKKMYEVLPSYDILSIGYNESGDKYGYTHMLSGNKYVGNFVILIRNKIIKDYPQYVECVENFEKSIAGVDLVFLNHRNENELLKKILEQW